MSSKATRDHIIEAADRLFYQQGFEHTSFSDIAEDVQISRGNFYYHFKTKDDILETVIEARLSDRQAMLDQWEQDGQTPEDRIRSFIHILINNRTDIEKYGCPVGTLAAELAKLNHAAHPEATGLFTLFREWLRQQFIQMGRSTDADELAMHLLARSQGVATLANSFKDEKFIRREVEDMCDWLKTYAQNDS